MLAEDPCPEFPAQPVEVESIMLRVQRDFLSDLRTIRDMRAFVREGCRQVWTSMSDDAAVAAIGLATGEAAANIILHVYHSEPNRPIGLAVTVDDEQARVALKYVGDAFDPRSVPLPDFDAGRESGYGLYLIDQSVDQVTWSSDDAGLCTMSLIKHRR